MITYFDLAPESNAIPLFFSAYSRMETFSQAMCSSLQSYPIQAMDPHFASLVMSSDSTTKISPLVEWSWLGAWTDLVAASQVTFSIALDNLFNSITKLALPVMCSLSPHRIFAQRWSISLLAPPSTFHAFDNSFFRSIAFLFATWTFSTGCWYVP